MSCQSPPNLIDPQKPKKCNLLTHSLNLHFCVNIICVVPPPKGLGFSNFRWTITYAVPRHCFKQNEMSWTIIRHKGEDGHFQNLMLPSGTPPVQNQRKKLQLNFECPLVEFSDFRSFSWYYWFENIQVTTRDMVNFTWLTFFVVSYMPYKIGIKLLFLG